MDYLYRVQVGPWTQQLLSKVHTVAAHGVIGRRVSVHGFAHLALQRYVVNAAASMQHPPKQAGVQHWGLPLFGYNAFAGAEKQVRPMAMRVLALKVDDLSMATVHTNVGPDQCPVGDISLNRKRSPSSGSLSSNSTASKCWPRKASEKKNLMVLTAPVTA